MNTEKIKSIVLSLDPDRKCTMKDIEVVGYDDYKPEPYIDIILYGTEHHRLYCQHGLSGYASDNNLAPRNYHHSLAIIENRCRLVGTYNGNILPF